jgi:hypothetical protein
MQSNHPVVDPVRHLAPGPVPAPAVARVHRPVLHLVCRPVKDRANLPVLFLVRRPVLHPVLLPVLARAPFLVEFPVLLPVLARLQPQFHTQRKSQWLA